MNRHNEVVITYSEWKKGKEDLFLLTIKTDKTGDRLFQPAGSDERNLSANKKHYHFPVGATIKLGQLHYVPIKEDFIIPLESGINFHIGVMNDGLNDICGPLAFARVVNMTDKIYNPPKDLMDLAWQAAHSFALAGKSEAEALVKSAGYESFEFDIGGPALNDPCVVEL